MNWFKKKKKKEQEQEQEQEPISEVIKPKTCEHKWCDFDWYLHFDYNAYDKTTTISLIEPYVCCWCKKREDKVLATNIYYNFSFKQAEEQKEKIIKMYKDKIKPKPLIEDEIEDMQRSIDRDYLRIVAQLYPEKLGSQIEKFKT